MIEAIMVISREEMLQSQHVCLSRILGIPDLEVRRVYLIEVERCLSKTALSALSRWLPDPILEVAMLFDTEADASLTIEKRHQVWLGFKRGVVDNESDSILRICSLLGIIATHAKVITLYLSNDETLEQRVRNNLFNPNIEELSLTYPWLDTLGPLGEYAQMSRIALSNLGEKELGCIGKANGRNLNLQQMIKIRDIEEQTGIVTTEVLLEALDARWSDHCYHTTWKSLGNLLRQLRAASADTRNPNIVSMFSDNAGIWSFYEGFGLALKAETHNSPSAISAYFGQLTKLGGVLRDILGAGLGADPVGIFEYTATGLPGSPSVMPDRPAPLQIASDTMRAIREYGNTFGAPMMWSHMTFHPLYSAKPFALGGAMGIIPISFAQKDIPQAGDLVMLIGGLTGNDGIHGASASSAGTVMDQTSVQIGSPLEEVKFRGAIIDLREARCFRTITDVGGAGLNSAVGEMGDPIGVWLNVALVPLKTAGLPMWRILLSESQERMILAIIPERLSLAREILDRHHVRHTVIGKFTGLSRYTVVYDPSATEAVIERAPTHMLPMEGEVGIEVPYDLLEYHPETVSVCSPPQLHTRPTLWPHFSAEGFAEFLPHLLRDPEIADQSYADSQYDSSVQGKRSYGPYEGTHQPIRTSFWASQLLPDRSYAVLFSTAFCPWLFEVHPVLALRQCFLSLIGTMILAGARKLDIALCDNFYTPHLAQGWDSWLISMVDELCSLIRQFGTPVISGKDSSAGSVKTSNGIIHVPPAAFLSAVAKAPDFDRLVRNEWLEPGSLLVRVGPTCRSAAGTVAGRVLGLNATDIDAPDVEYCRDYLDALERVDRINLLSGRQIGEGGVMALLARGSIASGLRVQMSDNLTPVDLCAEHRAGALIEIAPDTLGCLPASLAPQIIGRLADGGPSLQLSGVELLTPAAQEAWASGFAEKFR